MSLLEGIADINLRYTPTPALSFSANLAIINTRPANSLSAAAFCLAPARALSR